MVFKKYPDIERLGSPEVIEILDHQEDTIVIEEKVDGGNGCFWLEDDGLHYASRNRDLTLELDLKTFAEQRGFLVDLLKDKTVNPEYFYYLEWMQKHTIHYTNAPPVIGLDIRLKRSMQGDEAGLFLGRDAREQEFSRLGIENVPLVWRGKILDLKKMVLSDLIPKSKYYDGKAEGIVLKNFVRKSRFGNHQLYAKLVTDEFKEDNKAVFGGVRFQLSDTSRIVDRFATSARIRKVVLKNVNESGRSLDLSLMKFVPLEVFQDILREEIVLIATDYKYKSIDFKEMKAKIVKKCLIEIGLMLAEKGLGVECGFD